MTPGVALMTLRSRGIVFRLEGENIVCRAPDGVMTEAIRIYLRTHKAAISALLRTACRECNTVLYQPECIEYGICTSCRTRLHEREDAAI